MLSTQKIRKSLDLVIPTKCFRVVSKELSNIFWKNLCQTRSSLSSIYGYHRRVVSSKMPAAQTKTLSCCFLVWVALTGWVYGTPTRARGFGKLTLEPTILVLMWLVLLGALTVCRDYQPWLVMFKKLLFENAGQSIAVIRDPPAISLHSLQDGHSFLSLPINLPTNNKEHGSHLTGIWWFRDERNAPNSSTIPDIFQRNDIIVGFYD